MADASSYSGVSVRPFPHLRVRIWHRQFGAARAIAACPGIVYALIGMAELATRRRASLQITQGAWVVCAIRESIAEAEHSPDW